MDNLKGRIIWNKLAHVVPRLKGQGKGERGANHIHSNYGGLYTHSLTSCKVGVCQMKIKTTENKASDAS